MKMALINSLVEGEEITGFYLLKQADVKQTNSNPAKDYFDMVLADPSGEIPAKLWDVSSTDKETFFPMMLVKVQGVMHLYRDRPQIKIFRIRKAVDTDGYSLTDFIRSAPIEPQDLINTIHNTLSSLQDPEIRSVVAFCVSKVEDKLTHYPAAKGVHHAYYAGLAYHIVRMLELGEFVAKQRPFLNLDLIRAGIILHDIAKPEEMIAELGIVTDYSLTGKLLGHLSIAMSWITEAAIHLQLDVASEKIIVLQHLVLSHHNKGEWGSPIQPQLPEAVALHYIDTLDAKLQAVEDAIQSLSPSEEWTQPIRAIDNKAIYRLKWA
jgi:3'-5' exoribonuclease